MAGNMFQKRPPVPGIGYLRHRVDPEQLTMVGQWLVVEEIFDEERTDSGLFIASIGTRATTHGKIIVAGPECELDDLAGGDEIIYYEWQGGRHNLGGIKILIMSADQVLCKVERDGTSD